MKSGKVTTSYFEVVSSKHDHPVDCGYWQYTSHKQFDNSKDALKYFNEQVADPEVLKASLTWEVQYEECTEGCRTTSKNYFTIANYDHKAVCFENFATSNCFWESNRNKRPGIMNRYLEDKPQDTEPKSFKKHKVDEDE